MIGLNLPSQCPGTESLNRFTLITQTGVGGDPHRWRFTLRTPDGHDEMTAEDQEPDAVGDRLELLTLVRGLEALNQPSHVTILTRNRYIREGLLRGLADWRENGWHWECFQQQVPIKNKDLWKRVDQSLQFHTVDCRILRLDPPHPATGRSAKAKARIRRHSQSGKTCAIREGLPAERYLPDRVVQQARFALARLARKGVELFRRLRRTITESLPRGDRSAVGIPSQGRVKASREIHCT